MCTEVKHNISVTVVQCSRKNDLQYINKKNVNGYRASAILTCDSAPNEAVEVSTVTVG